MTTPARYRVHQIRVALDHDTRALTSAAARSLGVAPAAIRSLSVRRRAIDARGGVKFVYSADIELATGVRPRRSAAQCPPDADTHMEPSPGTERLATRPVVVGCGPSGLFAALELARLGYRPLVLERGKRVEERALDVERFWRDGVLDPESNAQFGEGGAGTFSDGKLNTLVGDELCRSVLETLVDAGAPDDILVDAKPHVGTDLLRGVVSRIRARLSDLGAEFRFGTRVDSLECASGSLRALRTGSDTIDCSVAVLAIGHSARDTFARLEEAGMAMVPKPFAIGARIEHPQSLIDHARYGASAGHPKLGAADYKLVWHRGDGRSAYTFCMCPGGHVMGASSHSGCVVTNGMSFHARDANNANAAVLVNVTPDDFGAAGPLGGIAFQERWERAAFLCGGGTYAAPAQRVGDFLEARGSAGLGDVVPSYRPGVVPADLRECLPAFVCDTIRAALPHFARSVRGFDMPDAVLTGVETRSSCPVRLVRNERMESSIGGVYPAGEGAGYAGGIMSSAVDGIRVARAIVARYARPDEQ